MERRDAAPEWVKDIDVSRIVENTLTGVILFLGAYLATAWAFLRNTDELRRDVVLQPASKVYTKVRFARPLVFLAISGFILLFFGFRKLGTLPLLDSFVTQHRWLTELLPQGPRDFSLAKIAGGMLPVILLIAIYSWLAFIVFRRAAPDTTFKVQLNIHCYTMSCFALAASISTVGEMHLWDGIATGVDYPWGHMISFFLGEGLGLAIAIVTLYRYLGLVKRSIGVSWAKTLALAAIPFAIFWPGLNALFFFLQPFISSLRGT